MKALGLSRRPKGKHADREAAEFSLEFKDIPTPEIPTGEALIRVRMAGICRTDQELVKGYMSFSGVPGHEFVGEVVEVDSAAGSQAKELIGKRVVGEINCGCGTCDYCHSGLERHCPQRTVLGIKGRDGAFAEYLTLPVNNLHVVPDTVDDQTAVFTEPLAAALEILEQVRIKPDDGVLVIGDGKLGLLIARILQLHGCRLLCLGSHPHKIELLKSWGIEAANYRDYQPVPCDLAVEASGSTQGFAIAVSALKARGTLIFKSTYAETLTFDVAPLVVNEITVIGSRCGPFAPALRLLSQNLIPTNQLISRIYPFDEAIAAFQYAAQGDALKVLLQF